MKSATVPAFDPASPLAASSALPQIALSDGAKALLERSGNVRGFLDALLAGALAEDALVVVARALPRRYVVAWACECLKIALADGAGKEVDRAGLALAQQWLTEPSEENRVAAIEFAERGDFGSPGAWIAASAGWSGGSLLPRGYDTIAPPDHLPAEAAVAALRFAAARRDDCNHVLAGFVKRALEIFGGLESKASSGAFA
jgi:hypothetical protein